MQLCSARKAVQRRINPHFAGTVDSRFQAALSYSHTQDIIAAGIAAYVSTVGLIRAMNELCLSWAEVLGSTLS